MSLMTHYSESDPTSLSQEDTHTNFLVFDFTQPGFEPTIYRTIGEHANRCGPWAISTETASNAEICEM